MQSSDDSQRSAFETAAKNRQRVEICRNKMPSEMNFHLDGFVWQESGVLPANFWHARCSCVGGADRVASELDEARHRSCPMQIGSS
jgi:hypothetical protein